MLMNVLKNCTTVTVMLNATTLLEVFHANVTMDTLEMAKFALVRRVSLSFFYLFFYIVSLSTQDYNNMLCILSDYTSHFPV